MKREITQLDLAVLDGLAMAADCNRQGLEQLVNIALGVLAIEGWNENANGAVSYYLRHGPADSMEDFLARLGVDVEPPPHETPNH